MAKNVKKYWTLKDIRSFTMKKFETVRLLLDAGMQKEAMIYMFHILAWLIENKHDVKKAPSSTVKEYFTDLVKSSKIPAQNVHPFVNIIEEMLYSHHELEANILDSYKEKWANIYTDLAGELPPAL
ncbi:MAG TPA: hypothetical protein VKM55_14080 [Candidatus Lokiarchaeia archaeon]|nr:hypothetical protein [Candidatus Lokiarchaeia archaeon]